MSQYLNGVRMPAGVVIVERSHVILEMPTATAHALERMIRRAKRNKSGESKLTALLRLNGVVLKDIEVR